jgi:ligand-binding SRPBCC domain-containing protein
VQCVFEHWVELPRDDVFRFHEDPANLARLLEGWPGFRVLRHGGSIEVGREVWVEQIFAGCVPIVMGFRHVVYERPHRFAEEVLHGPFARFHHEHAFAPAGPDARATRVRDTLELEVKPIFGGAWATRRFAEPFVRRMFAHRHAALERLARELGPARSARQPAEARR